MLDLGLKATGTTFFSWQVHYQIAETLANAF